MSTSLQAQLLEYGRYHDEQQRPVDVEDIVALADAVRVEPAEPMTPLPPQRRGPWLAAAAAIFIILMMGGLALWFQSGGESEVVDEPTETSLPTDEATESFGLVGPGAWSVVATLSASDMENLDSLLAEIETWPGVLDAVAARDAAGWLLHTGLQADCAEAGASPLCEPAIVAQVVVEQMEATRQRLETEFGMDVFTAAEQPELLVRGYLDAVVERASPAPLDFDTTDLGREISLVGPYVGLRGEQCGLQCDVVVELEADGATYRAGLEVEAGIIVEVALAGEGRREQLPVEGSSSGTGFGPNELLVDELGRGGAIAVLDDGVGGGTVHVHLVAMLPIDAAAVVFDFGDGNSLWQRPLGGIAFITEEAAGFGPPQQYRVLDGSGAEIMRVDASGRAVDLRINPSATGLAAPRFQLPEIDPAEPSEPTEAEPSPSLDQTQPLFAELALETTLSSLVGDIQWQVFDFIDGAAPSGPVVATPEMYVALDYETGLWASADGLTWQPAPAPAPGWISDLRVEGGRIVVEISAWNSNRITWFATVEEQTWSTSDLNDWSRAAPLGVVVPDLSGAGVVVGAFDERSATAGERTFAAWRSYAYVDWWEIVEQLGVTLPPPTAPDDQRVLRADWGAPDAVIEVSFFTDEKAAHDREGGETVAVLAVELSGEPESWSAELRDAVSGQLVTTIGGTLPVGSLDEVPDLLAHGYQASAYVLTEVDTSRLVTPDWIDVAASSDDGPMLGAVGDTLVAHLRIGHSGEQGSNTIWTSPDGESWTEFDAPWPDTWEVWCCPLESSGVGIVQINDGQEHWAFELWRSIEGASWQPAAVPPEIPWDQPAQIAVVNERWVAAGGGVVATSVDGDVWETLATDDLPAGDSHTVWSGGVAYRSLDGALLVVGTF